MSINKRNIRIGLFFIAAFVILVFGINYLKSQDLLFRGNKYYTFLPDVNGLTDASPVYYNGFKVGSVRNIDICPENTPDKRFIITLAIEYPLDVPADSYADLTSTDILGGMGMYIKFGQSSLIAESGDTLLSSSTPGLIDQLTPLKDKAEGMIVNADTALVGVNRILSGDNYQHIAQSLQSLDASLRNLERITTGINRLTSPNGALTHSALCLDTLMSTLASQSQNINTTMEGLSSFASQLSNASVDSLVITANAALAAITALLGNVDNANGSLGKIINDPKLYDKLAESSENLNRLLVDLRLNPKRYLKINALGIGGKSVYFSEGGSGLAMLGKVYTLSLAKSKTPLDFPTVINDQKVIEYHNGKIYEYLLGSFRERQDAETLRSNISANYPSATLKAFENGIEVNL